jgi:hypothetical protein
VYILGEMNCSCVGFSTQLELAHEVAGAAIRVVAAGAAVRAAGCSSDGESSGGCAQRALGETGSTTSEGSLAAMELAAA